MNIQELKRVLKFEREKYQSLEKSYNELLKDSKCHATAIEKELKKRELIEKNLTKQQTFLHQVINLNPNFIFAKNYQGEFTLVNDSLAEAFGSTPSQIIGKTDADFTTNMEEAKKFREDDLKVMDSQQELIISEEILTDAKGTKHHLRTVKRAITNSKGETTHILGVASDITQLMESQKQTSLLAEIVKSSNDAIACVSFEGQITCWNGAAETMIGYSSEEAIGKHIEFLCPKELIGAGQGFLKKILKGEQIKNVELKGIKSDNTVIDVELTISAIKDNNSRITGTSAIVRDISKRIAAEKELELHRKELSRLVKEKTKKLSVSQLRLRKAEKLAAMGTLASGIAHEINNPIGAIVLTAENTLESMEQNPSKAELYSLVKRGNQKIINNAHRCSMIIKEALQFATKRNTPKKLCDLNQLIENAVNLVSQYQSSKRCSVTMELDRSIPMKSVNPLEIEQLLVNIIQNAFESSETSVHVKVKTFKSAGKQLTITITDNGQGIPKEKQNRIFEAFYSSKKSQGGTGLGLSIAQQIVNAHKGKIKIASAERSGTTCTITFPLDNDKLKISKLNYSAKEKEFKKESVASSISLKDQDRSSASLSATSLITDSSGTAV